MKNASILDLYTDYLMASFSLTTATGMSAMLDGALSHDQISRFLGQGLADQKAYWKHIKPLVRRIETDAGIIKIDDTILEKPYSQENAIICWHYDHSKKGRDKNVKGINIVNFLYENSVQSKTIKDRAVFRQKGEQSQKTKSRFKTSVGTATTSDFAKSQ